MSTSDAPPSYYQAIQLTPQLTPLEEITIEKLRETTAVNRYEASGNNTFVRVPQKLYDIDSEAYGPRSVSLGLFHHPRYGSNGPNNVNFLAMEGYKQEGMLRLLDATYDREQTLAVCKEYVKRSLNKIHGCYNEKMDIYSELVGSIVLVDACFLLDFFLHRMGLSPAVSRVIEIDYSIFWSLRRDATLLENQIPFFVINELLHIISAQLLNPIDDASRHIYRNMLSLVRLTPETPQLMVTPQFSDNAHLLDLVNTCHLSMVDDARKSDFPPSFTVQLRSATQLRATGVRFKRADGTNLLAFKFENGCLSIPALVIHDSVRE